MKTASKVLNLIGTILLVGSIVGYIVSLALSAMLAEIAYQYAIRWLETAQIQISETFTAITIRTSIISSSGWGLIMSCVATTFGVIATVNTFLEKPGKTHHIFAIVAGGIGGTGFLIAGGILGLVASRHDERRAEPQVQMEKPKEETVVEVETEK